MTARTTEPKHWRTTDGDKVYVPAQSDVEVLYYAADQDGYNAESVCRFNGEEIVIKTQSLHENTR